jgi:hypothetical protein
VLETVTVDVAGGPMGGAARFREELYRYLARSGRHDIRVIGAGKRLSPAWLLRREVATSARTRRVALNNVGFVTSGGQKWTLLGNALHFLTDAEIRSLHPSLHSIATQQASVVRMAARRSDVLIAPCSAMADRVIETLPSVRGRVITKMHPVSVDLIPERSSENFVLCPILFEPYKYMPERLAEWVTAVDDHIDPAVRLLVTATTKEVPPSLAANRRINFLGQLKLSSLYEFWARSQAIFFPTGLESFGFPLAEARAIGRPVIARNTEQNKEIAGPALCAFIAGDKESLLQATKEALGTVVEPDPAPFDPDAYFDWMLGGLE